MCLSYIDGSSGIAQIISTATIVYLLNDALGMLVWATIFYTVNAFVNFEFMSAVMSPVTIASMNSIFRIATTVALFPFIKQIEKSERR